MKGSDCNCVFEIVRLRLSHVLKGYDMRTAKGKNRLGFTLVEVLIVVVILGILGATVLPQFTAASDDAKESALRQDLQLLRSQVSMYRFQHEGAYPGPTSTEFADQLTKASNLQGQTAAPGTTGYAFGPYLVGQLPQNPYNGGRAVRIVTGAVAAATVDPAEEISGEKVGWIFSRETGELKANSTGQTADGRDLDKI